MSHTPDSVMAWLRANYSAQTIAGQPGHIQNDVSNLVAWCNATRHLAQPDALPTARKHWEATVGRHAHLLEMVR